ncbi:YciI family protein [Paraburkholderia terrae]
MQNASQPSSAVSEIKDNSVSQDLSRRRFLISAAAGVASLAVTEMSPAMAASSLSEDDAVHGARLPPLPEVRSRNPDSMKVVNYATYVRDRGRVDASRAEHQAYADALREHDRLVMGGPLLDDGGRAQGVLLVYDVASNEEAETLAKSAVAVSRPMPGTSAIAWHAASCLCQEPIRFSS